MLSIFSRTVKTVPRGADFGHVLIDEQGKILFANQEFVDLARLITGKVLFLKGTIGNTIKDVFGRDTLDTVIGTFMHRKEKGSFSGNFMIAGQLYQVVVEEIYENNQAYYEFFYFPIMEDEGYSKERVFQNIAYKLASQKGFADIDWILKTSDNHCKQLITCLINHEHTTTPARYCPYRQRCKFHPERGYMQLDRRTYFRAKVLLKGELYLSALKDLPVSPEIAMKKISCIAQDLSIGGIKLQLKEICLPEESVVRLVFDAFTCEGIVVWTKKNQEDEWLMGIRFTEVDPEQHFNIIKIITKSRVVD